MKEEDILLKKLGKEIPSKCLMVTLKTWLQR